MPQTVSDRLRSIGTATLALMLAGVLLAACGSSSSSSSGGGSTAAKSTSTAARTTTAAAAAAAAENGGATGFQARLKVLRECLSKNGVSAPAFTKGAHLGGTAGGASGVKLPPGMTRAKLAEIVRKCGGSRRYGAGNPFLKSTSYRTALVKFAACMKEDGVNIPAPNTSGSGPVFSTRGLDTSSPSFQAAEKKCYPILRGGILGHGSPATGPSTTGAG